ncbi:hypothetical protein BDV18DRAFT_149942 [Aspergillus unguis]
METNRVAIIGAGLTGLSLALSLQRQSIPCIVYELRPRPLDIGGTVTLSPNALRILDTLGVYERIRENGSEWDTMYFMSQDDRVIGTIEYGSQSKYGYRALRIYRHFIITALLDLAAERKIPVGFGRKFSRVVSESDAEVVYEFADGSIEKAASLVGADGIHSRVRKYLYPELEPEFTNIVAVTAHVPTSQVVIPEGYPPTVTIMSDEHGAYVVVPANETETIVAKQIRTNELDREEWKRRLEDKKWVIDLLRRGAGHFPPIVRSAVSHIPEDKLNVWPFYVVPRLDSWVSKKGRVAILGDAAHAIPPSTGQGANQVFEDSYTYALILSKCRGGSLGSVMRTWQKGRQERIDVLLRLAEVVNARRLPKETNGHARETDADVDLDVIFKPDFDVMVDSWILSN